MAKIIFVDEEGQYLNRYKLTPVDGQPNVYDLVRMANITKQGTPIGADTMGQMLQVEDGVPVQTLACTKSATVYALTGLTATSGKVPVMWSVPTAYAAGDTVTIDGTAYTLRTVDGSALTAGAWAAGSIITGVADVDNKVLVVAPSAPAGARPATWTPTAAQVGAIPIGGDAGTVNGSPARRLQSVNTDGGPYGANAYDIQSRFNAKGDGRFRLEIVGNADAVNYKDKVSVGYADSASNVGGYSFEDSSADPSGSLPVGRVHFTWG